MTAAPDYARIKNLTFSTTTAEDNAQTRASWGWGEVAASAFILAAILGAYIYFRK
jgi:SSS family solute:Na+ symporter